MVEGRGSGWQFPDAAVHVQQDVQLCRIRADGGCGQMRVGASELMDEFGLQARDVLSLERSQLTVVQPRGGKSIILALADLRLLVAQDCAVVLLPGAGQASERHDSIVAFSQGLARHIESSLATDESPFFEMIVRTLASLYRPCPPPRLSDCPVFRRVTCNPHNLWTQVLEAVLFSLERKYTRRIRSFDVVVENVLSNVRKVTGSGDITQHAGALVPLSESLTRFEHVRRLA